MVEQPPFLFAALYHHDGSQPQGGSERRHRPSNSPAPRHRTHRHSGTLCRGTPMRRQRGPRPTTGVGVPSARHLGTQPHLLPHSRAGLALMADSPQPGALQRHQPSEPRAMRHPLPHPVVRAGPCGHERRSVLLCRQPHGVCRAPLLRRMRVPGPHQLAPLRPRPDCLRRPHTYRLPVFSPLDLCWLSQAPVNQCCVP
jgi:hypothetical protein